MGVLTYLLLLEDRLIKSESTLALQGVHIIAVAGGSCSGKSTLVNALYRELGDDLCAIVQQDDYYLGIDEVDNFDRPEAIEFSLLSQQLRALKNGDSIASPVYDFASHQRLKERRLVHTKPIVLLDGTLVLHAPELVPYIDCRVFVECGVELRKQRRLQRDVQERGRTSQAAAKQFDEQVEPLHQVFVEPSKASADAIFCSEADNTIAGLEQLLTYCRTQLGVPIAN